MKMILCAIYDRIKATLAIYPKEHISSKFSEIIGNRFPRHQEKELQWYIDFNEYAFILARSKNELLYNVKYHSSHKKMISAIEMYLYFFRDSDTPCVLRRFFEKNSDIAIASSIISFTSQLYSGTKNRQIAKEIYFATHGQFCLANIEEIMNLELSYDELDKLMKEL